jgi:hypothetical protein
MYLVYSVQLKYFYPMLTVQIHLTCGLTCGKYCTMAPNYELNGHNFCGCCGARGLIYQSTRRADKRSRI